MFRAILIASALLAATTAYAGDAEITLKFASDVAGALDRADPDGSWVAVAATTTTASLGADLLIACANAACDLVVSVDPASIAGEPWGRSVDGRFSVYAVDSIAFGPGARSGSLDLLRVAGVAGIVAPAGLGWEQAAHAHVAYVVLDNLTWEAVTTIPIVFH